MKTILTTLVLFSANFLIAQNYDEYFEGLKNIITIDSCDNINATNKNSNIECLNLNFQKTINNYFANINDFEFDSVKSNNFNSFDAYFELYYSSKGNLTDVKFYDFSDPSPDILNKNKKRVLQELNLLNMFISENYKIVKPAINFKNVYLKSKIPISVSVKILNDKISYHYIEIPTLIDFNDYSNTDERKLFYSFIYKKIENTFKDEFRTIASENNIVKCVAHLYFIVNKDGKIVDIQNKQNGNQIFEKYLINKLLEFKDEIEKNSIIAKLIDNTPVDSIYLMSFQYGYNSKY